MNCKLTSLQINMKPFLILMNKLFLLHRVKQINKNISFKIKNSFHVQTNKIANNFGPLIIYSSTKSNRL